MHFIHESLHTAFALILTWDREVFSTVFTSLSVSTVAIVLAGIVGIPCSLMIALRSFAGKRLIITLLNTLMALPTVVIGLLVYGLLSRQGPLGSWGLLFTPSAMIMGQTILATPIVANYTLAALTAADPRIITTAQTLGATPLQSLIILIQEIRFGVMAALIAGFGRIIAEVGVAMMLGGNIRHSTRTMTTAIALETSKGEFAFGLALGMILLCVSLIINLFLNFLQQR